jgi:hypothetical protein
MQTLKEGKSFRTKLALIILGLVDLKFLILVSNSSKINAVLNIININIQILPLALTFKSR